MHHSFCTYFVRFNQLRSITVSTHLRLSLASFTVGKRATAVPSADIHLVYALRVCRNEMCVSPVRRFQAKIPWVSELVS